MRSHLVSTPTISCWVIPSTAPASETRMRMCSRAGTSAQRPCTLRGGAAPGSAASAPTAKYQVVHFGKNNHGFCTVPWYGGKIGKCYGIGITLMHLSSLTGSWYSHSVTMRALVFKMFPRLLSQSPELLKSRTHHDKSRHLDPVPKLKLPRASAEIPSSCSKTPWDWVLADTVLVQGIWDIYNPC